MDSILEFIYVLFFVPSDNFLYISLLLISLISVYIIVQQSRPITQTDLEAPEIILTEKRTEELQRLASLRVHHLPQTIYHDVQPATSDTEAESKDDQSKTYQPPSQSSRTGMSIHSTPPRNLPAAHFFWPGSQHGSLLETGGLFADDNRISNTPSPRSHEHSHGRGGSTSSLELSD
jgi:hypothetical protein